MTVHLLDLPDELLCLIVSCFQTTSPRTYCTEQDWASARAYMNCCKRLQTATRNEPWTGNAFPPDRWPAASSDLIMTRLTAFFSGWELCSERVERLAEHTQHPQIINRIRDLRLPLVQTQQHADQQTHIYDRRLADTVKLFSTKLASMQLVFADWESGDGDAHTVESMHSALARDRRLPLCFRTIEAAAIYMPVLASVSFEGIRTGEDHGLVLSLLRKAPQVEHLSLSYRMDWAVLNALHQAGDVIQSTNLWRIIGDMEKLRTLRISCLPADDIGKDRDWKPDVWLPQLRRLDLCRVPMSRGLLSKMLSSGPGLVALALDEYSAQYLSSFAAEGRGLVQASVLRHLTLAGLSSSLCQGALKPFAAARLTKLDLSLSSIEDAFNFMDYYKTTPLGFAVEGIILNIHSEEMPWSARLVQRYKAIYAKKGIELEVRLMSFH